MDPSPLFRVAGTPRSRSDTRKHSSMEDKGSHLKDLLKSPHLKIIISSLSTNGPNWAMTDASAAPCIKMTWIKDNFVFGHIFHFSEYSKVQLGGWRVM